MSKSRIGTLILLHVLLGVYSLSDVSSKAASGFPFMSIEFIVLYFVVLALLFVYALGWQQVIKRMPLSSAFANRAITIVWGIFWGVLLFGESVTVGKVVGAAVIIAGIVLFSKADADLENELAADTAVGTGENGAQPAKPNTSASTTPSAPEGADTTAPASAPKAGERDE